MDRRQVEKNIVEMIRSNNLLREENAKLREQRNHAMAYSSHLFTFTMSQLENNTPDVQDDSDDLAEERRPRETLTYEKPIPRPIPLNFTLQDYDNFMNWYHDPKNSGALRRIDLAQEEEEKKDAIEAHQYDDKLVKFTRAKRATRRKALAQKRETFIGLAALENAASRMKHASSIGLQSPERSGMGEANQSEIVFKLPDGKNLSFEEYIEALKRWDDHSNPYDVLAVDESEESEIDDEIEEDSMTVSEVRKREDGVMVLLPGGRECTLKEFNDFRDHWMNPVNDAMDEEANESDEGSEDREEEYRIASPENDRKSRAIGVASLEAVAYENSPHAVQKRRARQGRKKRRDSLEPTGSYIGLAALEDQQRNDSPYIGLANFPELHQTYTRQDRRRERRRLQRSHHIYPDYTLPLPPQRGKSHWTMPQHASRYNPVYNRRIRPRRTTTRARVRG